MIWVGRRRSAPRLGPGSRDQGGGNDQVFGMGEAKGTFLLAASHAEKYDTVLKFEHEQNNIQVKNY